METVSHGSQLPVNSNYSNVLLHVGVNRISPSPYQHRKYFNEDRLRELAASIQREGLIQPIVVRPINGGYELIAGERRLRAVRDYTGMDKIVCSIVEVDDLQARRMSAAENLQREDLSTIETIEAIVEVIDSELVEDRDYAGMGATPLDRVKIVLRKIDSDRRSTERGFSSKNVTKETSNKFIRRIEMIFSNLPKPLEWQSFFKNDLPLLRDFCQDVRDVSDRHHLNRSQIRALIKLKTSSDEAFQEIIGNTKKATPPDRSPGRDRNKSNVYPFPSDVTIGDLSAREIEEVADKITQKEIRTERNRPRISPSLNLSTKILMMTRLGMPVDRIAGALNIGRKSVFSHSAKEEPIIQGIRVSLRKGVSIPEVARKHHCPEPLIWSIALEGKSDQERFKLLNWGLRAWDYWYFNDIDRRFGDEWPGRIPAQLVAHTLFYLTREGDLVFDPMAGGGVVPDVCLAFHRKCWSFDLAHRPETRPEIEAFQWDPNNLLWPVSGKMKPDLIFFDAPYFKKMAASYSEGSVSGLSKNDYLEFFRDFFMLAMEHVSGGAHIAFLNADWRDFQGISAREENPEQAILLFDYIDLLRSAGWKITHLIDCPLSLRGVGALRAGGHTAFPWKRRERHAKKPNPRHRPPIAYHGKKSVKSARLTGGSAI